MILRFPANWSLWPSFCNKSLRCWLLPSGRANQSEQHACNTTHEVSHNRWVATSHKRLFQGSAKHNQMQGAAEHPRGTRDHADASSRQLAKQARALCRSCNCWLPVVPTFSLLRALTPVPSPSPPGLGLEDAPASSPPARATESSLMAWVADPRLRSALIAACKASRGAFWGTSLLSREPAASLSFTHSCSRHLPHTKGCRTPVWSRFVSHFATDKGWTPGWVLLEAAPQIDSSRCPGGLSLIACSP